MSDKQANTHERRLTRRQFLGGMLRGAASGALAAGTLGSVSCRRAGRSIPNVVTLGMDGLDADLLRRYIAGGHLPNFARFIRDGTFSMLRTTWPPQSPTAWSTFITGKNPGGHGIFDMVIRDPESYETWDVLAYSKRSTWALEGDTWRVPLVGSKVLSRRGGIPFWRYLCEAGVPASLYKVPADFPPEDYGARTLSGLGTMDMTGEIGQYCYYTDVPPASAELSGVRTVKPVAGKVTARLYGPLNPWTPQAEKLTCPFTVHISSDQRAMLIDICGQRILLRQGEWSDWVVVRFSHLGGVDAVTGTVRFCAKHIAPRFGLYVSPVNINPLNPAIRISTPDGLAAQIAREIGPYYTQGLPSEFKARMDNILNDEDYFAQSELVWQERERLFDYAWRRFDRGLLFFYFTLSDMNSHMFWRTQDPSHPAYTEELERKYGHVIRTTYKRLDGLLGRVLDEMPPRTTLMVLSDHGFGPLKRYFCVNRWLRERGLYALKVPGREQSVVTSDVDWGRTAAYWVGYNSIYINRKGREKHGIVGDTDAAQLCRKIQADLPAVVDPDTGRHPVSRVFRKEELYSGPYLDRAPDLVVGFNRDYGTSVRGILGGTDATILRDNRGVWSGSHLIDPDQVPGVLITNRKLQSDSPGMEDVGPSICKIFGAPTGDMEGRSFFGD